jgi:hypothetical protein
MMKKIFALVLVLLMLIPLVVACKTGDGNTDTNTNTNTNTNTSTNTNTNTNTDTNTDTNVGSDKTAQEEIDAIKESFKGQTINVLASGTFSGQGDPSAPWGQAELCVPTKAELENYDPTDPEQVDPMTKGFGVAINTQLMNRKNYVETTYGVTLNYIDCRGAVMQTRLRTAAGNTDIGGEVIHIAMPRVLEAQAIVIDQSVMISMVASSSISMLLTTTKRLLMHIHLQTEHSSLQVTLASLMSKQLTLFSTIWQLQKRTKHSQTYMNML